MLKWRVVTALVLAPLALTAIWFLPTAGFAVALAGMISIAAWEWSRLIGFEFVSRRVAYLASVWLVLAAGAAYYFSGKPVAPVLGAGAVWWCGVLAWLVRFNSRGGAGFPSRLLTIPTGWLLFGFSWFALTTIHGDSRHGPAWVIVLMLIVWGADVGAYFCGRAFGRRKLAPRISPGKTWEGVAGGLALAVLASVAAEAVIEGRRGLMRFGVMVAITVAFSVAGDLFESMIKRRAGVKDSGNLLPGHGGMLDRIDSLLAAAPIFAMGLLWL